MTKFVFSKQGFTLVELLVVIGIIGILVGMLLPAVQAVRETARRTMCQNNLRQIGTAIQTYESIWRKYPPGRIGCDKKGGEMNFTTCDLDAHPEEKTGASGFVSILPQLQQQGLADELAVDDGGLWNEDDDNWLLDTAKVRGVKMHLDIYWCPSENSSKINDVYFLVEAANSTYAFCNGSIGPPTADYVIKYQNDGAFVYRDGRRLRDLRDGLSNIFLVGEIVRPDIWESSNIWNLAQANADCLRNTANPLNTRPGDGILLDLQNGAFASWHPGGGSFVFADGHVGFVNQEIDLSVYRALSTINGQEF